MISLNFFFSFGYFSFFLITLENNKNDFNNIRIDISKKKISWLLFFYDPEKIKKLQLMQQLKINDLPEKTVPSIEDVISLKYLILMKISIYSILNKYLFFQNIK